MDFFFDSGVFHTVSALNLETPSASDHSKVVLVVKNPPANAGDIRDMSSIPGSGRSPGEGNGKPTPGFLPEKSHEQMSPADYRP